MIEKNKCFLLGYIQKSSGLKGEVIANLDVDEPLRYNKLESVFLELEGELVPFFVTKINIRPANSSALIQFEDITDNELAKRLIGSELYLPLEFLPKLTGKKFYFHEVVGYKVIDSVKGDVGVIKSVVTMTAQPIFQITAGKKEVLIPAVDTIIDKIDREKREIYVTAPEGLIDIYIAD